jgi:hypothetical protein
MKHQEQIGKREQTHTVAWLEELVAVTKSKKSALLQNDLKALEACLEHEAQLLMRKPIFQKKDSAIPRSLLAELRATNRANRTLVTNGLDLTRTLLDTIHPPTTYSMMPQRVPSTSAIGPAISVKG